MEAAHPSVLIKLLKAYDESMKARSLAKDLEPAEITAKALRVMPNTSELKTEEQCEDVVAIWRAAYAEGLSHKPAEEMPAVPFEDPRVQAVYGVLCDTDTLPPEGEHWEGFVARRIVNALLPGLSVEQEPKYTVNGHAIVNRVSGEEIPADEPVFVFRARDKYAASLIGEYMEFCSNPQHRAAVEARFHQFSEWADAHPDRMKEPDTDAVASETYCLACGKLGHLTTDCWSTHGLNTPEARELFRLVGLANQATRAAEQNTSMVKVSADEQVAAARAKCPYYGHLKRAWLDGFDGVTITCYGTRPEITARRQGREARAALKKDQP
jgi:hypothetical protein